MENKQKRLLLLGGLRYLLPVIDAAHKQGYYVITCDYIPNNIAHQYSDEYHNVSIVDKEAVLDLAQELHIDGIMSFAVDPGVITAAYVQEKMHLPGNPYDSVCILQNKDRFRKFLTSHKFNVPKSKCFFSMEKALSNGRNFHWPVIVKPTDSAGSKGVTRVDKYKDLESALENAFKFSIAHKVIIEEFIAQQDCSSDSDCFSVDGKLKFVSFSAQRFDKGAANPYTPSAYSWPSTMSYRQKKELTSELQRLISLLGMKTSIYNVETRIGINRKPYIMEVSPRGGGNRLSEMLYYATGTDLITNAVRTAVGDNIINLDQKSYEGYWAEVILHSNRDGKFSEVKIDDSILPNVIETDLWVKQDHIIKNFNGANDAIGTLVLRFDSNKKLSDFMEKLKKLVTVNIQ